MKTRPLLSIVALLVAVLALIVSIFRIIPNVVITNDTYIGTIATFMGITTTLIVGYQIYNSIDFKGKVRQIELLTKELNSLKDKVERSNIENQFLTMELRTQSFFDRGVRRSFNPSLASLLFASSFNESLKCLIYAGVLNDTSRFIFYIRICNYLVNKKVNIRLVKSSIDKQIMENIAQIRANNNVLYVCNRSKLDRIIKLYLNKPCV